MSEDNSRDRVGVFSHCVSPEELKEGDQIYVYRYGFLYSHHGIYAGENKVIHFSGQRKDKSTARITSCTLEEFCHGSQLRLVAYNARYVAVKLKRSGSCHTEQSKHGDKVLARAEFYLDNPHEWRDYHLFSNNCENFAFYCKTAKSNNPDGQSGDFVAKIFRRFRRYVDFFSYPLEMVPLAESYAQSLTDSARPRSKSSSLCSLDHPN